MRGVVPSRQRPGGRPFRKGHAKTGGRTKGTPNRVTTEMKTFLVSVISDPEYQDAARERMIAGRAPHLETLALYYAHGKPRETVEVEQSPDMAQLLLLAHRHLEAEDAKHAKQGAEN